MVDSFGGVHRLKGVMQLGQLIASQLVTHRIYQYFTISWTLGSAKSRWIIQYQVYHSTGYSGCTLASWDSGIRKVSCVGSGLNRSGFS